MYRQPGHSDYGWRMKDFCDTLCRVKFSQSKGVLRCKFCGDVLPELPRDRTRTRKNMAFCNRECFRQFVHLIPHSPNKPDEPSDEEKAEYEQRREEIWQRNFGHLRVCLRTDG